MSPAFDVHTPTTAPEGGAVQLDRSKAAVGIVRNLAVARAMIRIRGAVGSKDLARFLEAGLTKRQALDVVLGMGFSQLANYAAHLTNPPPDDFLQGHRGTAPGGREAVAADFGLDRSVLG